jgi:hypothetical protein
MQRKEIEIIGSAPETQAFRQDQIEDFELDSEISRRGQKPSGSLDQRQVCKSERMDSKRFSARLR